MSDTCGRRCGRRRERPVAAGVLACTALSVLCLLLSIDASARALPSADRSASPSRTTTAHLEQSKGTSARPPRQPVVLAADEGLTLLGPLGALAADASPRLDDLSHARAAGLAALPARNVFFRGASVHWSGRAGSPLLLTFALPKAVFAGTRLRLYRLHDGRWLALRRHAVVGRVNTTATATIGRAGRYVVCLGRAWRTVVQDGYRLVIYTRAYARTRVVTPVVLARGATDDPAVIEAVADVTGESPEDAQETLVSYDSSTVPVTVLRLTVGTPLVRSWSGTSTVGRWFAPSTGGELPGPEASRALYALPAGNLATDATLHRVKAGTDLIAGICADMTSQPGYGTWATGGGEQYFGPAVSTYPPPAYDSRRIVVIADLRWLESELDDIEW